MIFRCPGCDAEHELESGRIGLKVECPCGRKFRISEEDLVPARPPPPESTSDATPLAFRPPESPITEPAAADSPAVESPVTEPAAADSPVTEPAAADSPAAASDGTEFTVIVEITPLSEDDEVMGAIEVLRIAAAA